MKCICDRTDAPDCEDSYRAAVELCAAAEDFESIVYSWVGTERKVILCPAEHDEDDDPNEEMICLVFEENGQEVAYAYFPIDQIKQDYPKVIPVSKAERPVNKANPESIWEDCARDKWFRHRDKKVRAQPDDDLCGTVVGKQGSIEIALSYALSNNGQAKFSNYDREALDDWFEDQECPSRFKNGVIWASFSYSNSINGRGWIESFYILAE